MNESFGQRLKRLRKEASLSQQKLAKACGWDSQSRIGNYETDKREPSLSDIAIIAKALAIPESELLLQSIPGTFPLKASSGEVIADLLAEHCQGLPDHIRDQIVAIANGSSVSAEPHGKPGGDGLFTIPYYDAFGMDGHGPMPDGCVRVVHHLVVDSNSLSTLGVHAEANSDLEVICAWSPDMEGTIDLNDQVIVDSSVKAFRGDGVYLITWLEQLYLRRIEKVGDDQYELIPDNARFTRRLVDSAAINIHAKVLVTMKASKV